MKAANRSRTIRVADALHPHHIGMAVEMAIEEGLDVPVGLHELFGKMRHRPPRMTHIVGRLRLDLLNVRLGDPDHVLDHAGDLPPHHLVNQTRLLKTRITVPHLGQQTRNQRQLLKHLERDQPRTQPVVNIMGVVGDIVGNRGDLALETGMGRQPQIMGRIVLRDRLGHRLAVLHHQRTIVLDQPFERFPGQVQPVEIGVALLQLGDDASDWAL
jgi:hypothetical protein